MRALDSNSAWLGDVRPLLIARDLVSNVVEDASQQLQESGLAIALGIVGVAILAVLVSNKANTVGVIQALASGFGNSLSVAVSPVTGSTVSPNLSYPSNTVSGDYVLTPKFPVSS